ncbi:hypothetical protein BVX95_00405 [archaeon D22]|nr:hypothetical protein BVX95_00405 [archaeon D22]
MSLEDIRTDIVGRLEKDLIGPDAIDEQISGARVKPSDVYLTGILWPLGDRMDGADDDGADGDDESDESASTPGLIGQQRPCTMGVSFATSAGDGEHVVSATIDFASYKHELTKDEEGNRVRTWTRKPFTFTFDELTLPLENSRTLDLKGEKLTTDVQVHIRSHRAGDVLLSTITLINKGSDFVEDRITAEEATLFQTKIIVRPSESTNIVSRPGQLVMADEDERIASLLFRDCREFSTGHQCSSGWKTQADNSTIADEVYTTWIPRSEVHAVRADGHDVFKDIVTKGLLDTDSLSKVSDKDLVVRLKTLHDAYSAWIGLQYKRVPSLPNPLQEIASKNLQRCKTEVLDRILSGILRIENDPNMMMAFRLANAAMALQHSWKPDMEEPLRWRPFQLGFILLSAESTCDSSAPDRDILDLLWFPTGGGKTEAYLTLIAMLAFYRNLVADKPDGGSGNAAVMRYTLRLLTAQQFERASSLILAAELIRRGAVNTLLSQKKMTPLGGNMFSIGLWVGGDATPNNFETALSNRGNKDVSTAEQISNCPCCQARVRWRYDEKKKEVSPHCEGSDCLLGLSFGDWPVYTVDEDIYQKKPTLVIGTIDKFALLPTRVEVSQLFGMTGTNKRPDLIIQDELHLISGPLGTIAGIYETAFDWLLSDTNKRPKVIGSTATIRRASEQVRALFDRECCQFPPPGLDHDDNGFAVRDYKKPGRLYLSVTTAGRSAKFSLQATAGSILHSTGPSAIPDNNNRDGYATLLCYFNSLRELGGAIVQMLDDVPDSITLYSGRRAESSRKIKDPKELTSRVPQKEIVEILDQLKKKVQDPDCVDVVLATNMVSVGVDVSRLGIQVVNGQPKTRSEYIQATSRVGRSKFPGLVVSVLNAAKPRDRSHFETFPSWHQKLYKDVEATSVTPFASRSRDRALHAVLVAMLRHHSTALLTKPDLNNASDQLLSEVVSEIERRIESIDPREIAHSRDEIDALLSDWDARSPRVYMNDYRPAQSLLQSADRHARRRAAGLLVGAAWPTMNNMRSVEPSSKFKLVEALSVGVGRKNLAAAGSTDSDVEKPQPRWRIHKDG